ncbi:YbaY family lipoprotein [Alcanivorax sp. S6407]|uniref:YbaY family lipoprotein n=1 Tax=Alcanivorax sp. S6407 TaxID=2926424 RepID=UPI001FF491B8|nr:YbaY family lipoprotein [Alcanivorax sp. S6407]MCK0152110.1 YbaY family lipoprotein [Alcanivorax sp. S6407]
MMLPRVLPQSRRCSSLLLSAMLSGLLLSGCNDSNAPVSESSDNVQQATKMDEQRVISGKVMYRERVALPPNVTVTVTLADVSRADAPMKVLAEEHIDNPGQVPVPFSLRYQTASVTQSHPLAYAVRAQIRDADGKLLWTTTQRNPVDLSAEVAPDEITLMLQRVASADAATLSPAMQDASDAGATFWAMGNEPGWHVVVYPDEKILFVGDYGDTEVSLPFASPLVEGTETQYQTGNEEHRLTLAISEQDCQDSMSGKHYDYAVQVTLNEHEYRGCGSNL